jgi:hypothetical protein
MRGKIKLKKVWAGGGGEGLKSDEDYEGSEIKMR